MKVYQAQMFRPSMQWKAVKLLEQGCGSFKTIALWLMSLV